MDRMNSQSWKPVVYISVTIAGVALVLGFLFLCVWVVHPGFSLVGLRRDEGKLTLIIAGAIAYGTVIVINRLLKKYYGREFGTYLDDPDEIEPGPRPPMEKICTRCGAVFAAFRNDFHAAGFCSRGCQEAFAKRKSN